MDRGLAGEDTELSGRETDEDQGQIGIDTGPRVKATGLASKDTGPTKKGSSGIVAGPIVKDLSLTGEDTGLIGIDTGL